MLTIQNVSKIIGSEYLLRDVTFTINENEKLGIVGRNGVGKSTLLKIIENDEYATDGSVNYAKHSIAVLEQEKQLTLTNTLREEMDEIKHEQVELELKMQEIVMDENFATDEQLIKEYGKLEERFILLDGYEIDSKIKKMFSLFGFNQDDYSKLIQEFSGGQKTRIALIKILMQNPDYLILDEPTNHLDTQTIEWLEDYLRLKANGVIIVSHDRFFLERVCNKIIEIENQTTHEYNMRYSDYINEKERRFEFQMNAFENQQMEIKRLEEFIDKNKKRTSKIGQVKDRKRKLEQIELIDKPVLNNEKVYFEIEGFRLKKAPYMDLLDADIGYEIPIISNVNFTVQGGDRIGIIGENGTGKTTLIKTMTKEIKPLAGRALIHPKINVGYFEQEQTSLSGDEVVYDVVAKLMPGESQTQIRKHLAKFLFKREDVHKKVSVLSGGEKVRLIFATFVLKKYDMIIMDEPTNHLDLSAKFELESVLKQYSGTLVVISHDRYFVNQVVDKIFCIDSGSYHVYDGNYEDYLQIKASEKVVKVKKKQAKVIKKKINKKNTKKLEREIEELEAKKDVLEQEVLKEEVYTDWQKLAEIQTEIETIKIELNKKYEELLGE